MLENNEIIKQRDEKIARQLKITNEKKQEKEDWYEFHQMSKIIDEMPTIRKNNGCYTSPGTNPYDDNKRAINFGKIFLGEYYGRNNHRR